jgi:FAD:protein FMN transferase
LLPASNNVRRARPLLGTFVEIAVAGAAADADAAIEAAFAAVARVHALMSFHEPTSDVSRLNKGAWPRAVGVHPWTFQVLTFALELHRRSGGIFDIAVAPMLQDLGLLPREAPVSRRPGAPATTGAIELLSGRRVRFHHRGLRIDLGGIAKGFAVDRAIAVLRERGMPQAVVNAGGDLAAFGLRPETIHVRDPREPSRFLLAIEIENQALASSGYRFDLLRSAKPLGAAVIDPRTRAPVEAVAAATVRAPTCMIADALTKVVMVAGTSSAPILEHHRAGALMVRADGSVEMTDDLTGAACLAA